MVKPIVECELYAGADHLIVGHSAIILPKNHRNHLPEHFVSNVDLARTSMIISIDAEACMFETQNTLYHWTVRK